MGSPQRNQELTMKFAKLVGLAAGIAAWVLTATSVPAAETNVAVAANFTDAAREIADAFKAKTGHEAVLSFCLLYTSNDSQVARDRSLAAQFSIASIQISRCLLYTSKACLVDRLVADQDVALVADELQIRNLDLAEEFRERIDPEPVRKFRIAHGDMPVSYTHLLTGAARFRVSTNCRCCGDLAQASGTAPLS